MRCFEGPTWEEELIERFLLEGERRGTVKVLRLLLEQRFGTLPEELLLRIEGANIEQLQSALDAMLTLRSLNELKL
jgi:hypothetical protein